MMHDDEFMIDECETNLFLFRFWLKGCENQGRSFYNRVQMNRVNKMDLSTSAASLLLSLIEVESCQFQVSLSFSISACTSFRRAPLTHHISHITRHPSYNPQAAVPFPSQVSCHAQSAFPTSTNGSVGSGGRPTPDVRQLHVRNKILFFSSLRSWCL
jgi:hypothetical protein